VGAREVGAQNTWSELRARLRATAEQVTDLIVGIDDQGTITFASSASGAMFGYPPEEMRGRHLTEFLDASPLPGAPDGFGDGWLQTEPGKTLELMMKRRDGSSFIGEVTGASLAPGELNGTLVVIRDITERTRAEAALRSLTERLAMSLEVANAGVWEWDLTTDEVRFDAGFNRLLGYDPGELPTTIAEWMPYHHPVDVPIWTAKAEAYLRGDSPFYESEHRIRAKTGPWNWVFTRGKVVKRDPTGSPEQFIGVALNVTERKQTEESLSLTQFSVDHAGDAIFWISPSGRIIYANELACRELGYSPRELMSMSAFDITVGMLPHTWPDRWQRIKDSGTLNFEEERLKKDGTVFPVEVTINFLEYDDQEFVLVFARDVSERKRAESLQRETSARLELALDSSKMGVWDWDVVTGLIEWSPQMFDLFELDPDSVTGSFESWRSRLHPEDLAMAESRIGAALQERTTLNSDYRLLLPDGRIRWINARGEGAYDDQGLPVRMLGICWDITERKQAEASLLEREEQLRQSQKMEAVGQLAGGIAHDFNNLLTTITGYSELLLSSAELAHTPALEDIKEIKLAADRAAALTRQILAFSRKQALRPTSILLNDVLTAMVPLLNRTLGEDIDLVSVLQADLGHAEVDLHQFEQVLTNLALNARDAMPAGGRLTLETANTELDEGLCLSHPGLTPGDFVMLAVSDTGIGMGPAILEHIFEPFFTTKAPGEGTGLGLAVVYGIVKQSHGSISVSSEPGKGTTFRIYLPRVSAREAVEVLAPPAYVPSSARETVMVVEDEPSLRSLIERVLTVAGYRVFSFGSAAEAIAAFDEGWPVDLLLTDVVLPGGMQGNELVRMVQDARPELPVLYMSGYTRDAIVHAGRLDEGVTFLEKPFTPENLTRMVGRVLEQSRC
jgi:two-component system cell cycle sensor histidine kinase/response regulator CckA